MKVMNRRTAMKTEYSRYKEIVRKIFPRKLAGSKRGQSALSVFLIVLLIVAMAVGVGMIYKVYNPKAPFVQKINNRYRINIVMKTTLNTNSYNTIYNKINEFNNKKNRNIKLSVIRNPMFIG